MMSKLSVIVAILSIAQPACVGLRKPIPTASDLKAVTDSQIKVLQRIIDVTNDDDPEKPDLLFRMAELFTENKRYYNSFVRGLDSQIKEAQKKNPSAAVDQLRVQQRDFDSREKQWLLEAVKKYIEVADGPKYQNYEKMDQVLLDLAYLLTKAKYKDQGRVFFKRLIRDYPLSTLIPHAYISFGDYFFENRDFENALKFYEEVLQYGDGPLHGYALYKMGWVYYNLTDFKQALATFVELIGYARDRSNPQLIKEAKKDLVRAYAQIGTPKWAWLFFQRYGGNYAPVMLEQLADLYNSQGKFLDSIRIYRELIKQNPDTTKLCSWQTEILKNTLAYTGERPVPETVKEMIRLSAVYEKTQTMTGVKKELVDECRDNTASFLRELATVWHKEAQKTGVMDAYANTLDLYKEYLRRFPGEKDSYLMHYWYGELLFKLGSLDSNPASHWYCDAAPVYTEVVKLDSKGPKLKDAAYAAVISWMNCLDLSAEGEEGKRQMLEVHRDKMKDGRQPTAEAFNLKPIPDERQKLLEAFDTHVKSVPMSADNLPFKYLGARIYYQYNHFEQAIPVFKDIADNYQNREFAMYSANLLLDSYVITSDLRALRAELDKIARSPELLRDEEFRKRIEILRIASLREEIEEIERQGDYRQAGILYRQLADQYPNDPRLAEVYYNAGVDFEKTHLIGLAIQTREKLIKEKPEHELAKKALYRVGQNYQTLAAYENAAEKYETFATRYPGEVPDKKEIDSTKSLNAPLALNTAAIFRRGLGQIDKSIEDVNQFVKTFGGRREFYDQSAAVFFGMAQIFEQKKDYVRLKGHLNQYLKDWAHKGGVDRQIVAEVMLGEIAWRDSCPVAGVNGACIDIKRERATAATLISQRTKKLLDQCGPETRSKITVHDRRLALVKEATERFQRALALYRQRTGKPTSGDESTREGRAGNVKYHAALARMHLGDLEYERLLSMQVPSGLVFDETRKSQDRASKKRFAEWIRNKAKVLKRAQEEYEAVTRMESTHFTIAAKARIGQLFQNFANELYTAPVPPITAPPPGIDRVNHDKSIRDNYCKIITDFAIDLDKEAKAQMEVCLTKTTQLSWINEWSTLCESELHQMDPKTYPLAAEIRAEPGYSITRMSMAPIVTTAAPETRSDN